MLLWQIRARAAHIARSLVFSEATLEEAKPLEYTEDTEEPPEPSDDVKIADFGSEVTIGKCCL